MMGAWWRLGPLRTMLLSLFDASLSLSLLLALRVSLSLSAFPQAARGGKGQASRQDLLGIVGKIAQRPRHLQTALSLVYECARAHCANGSSVGGMVHPPLSSLDGSS
jgi:hypothetical protein